MPEPLLQVDLSDETLAAMLKNPNFTNRFPFLATTMARAQNAKAGCGGCGRRRRTVHIDYGQVRRQISEMPAQEKIKLKQLLNTRQVSVRYTRPNGQTVKLRF